MGGHDMKEGRTATTYILLLLLISIFAGIAAADATFYSGSSISTSTSASVVGTINETVSMTKTTLGGEIEKTELTNSYTSVNPFGLSWRSHLSANSDGESAWVDYTRTGDLPRLTWRQSFRK
jgi:hypothetical protein